MSFGTCTALKMSVTSSDQCEDSFWVTQMQIVELLVLMTLGRGVNSREFTPLETGVTTVCEVIDSK